jgi:ribose-phosphate pyrophosphokinase
MSGLAAPRSGGRDAALLLGFPDYHEPARRLAAAAGLAAASARTVDILVTHALFAPRAAECLRHDGSRDLANSDSIPHPSNAMPLAGLLAAELDAK